MSISQTPPPDRTRRLEQLVLRARAALAFEGVWRIAALVATLAALFVAAAWLGLWVALPGWGRAVLTGGCGLAALVLLLREWRWKIPTRADGLTRIDRDSGFEHPVASALEDRLANDSADPQTQALWRLHQSRLSARLDKAEVAPPAPKLARLDVFALRGAAIVLLIAAAIVAGPERGARLASAFDFGKGGAAGPGLRLDAWIDPPIYTGRPPLILSATAGEAGSAGRRVLQAPAGSAIIVRSSDLAALVIETDGAIAPAEPPKASDPSKVGETQKRADDSRRFVLKGDGHISIRSGNSTPLAFDIGAIADNPPTVDVLGQPKANVRGSLTLAYKFDDDYGVLNAEARFAAPELDGQPIAGRTLVEAPRIGLMLPQAPNGLGDGETTADLSDHPWAGARVTMTLHARDEAGNEGVSDPLIILLPQRAFTKPLARALVEQRRNLVLAPDRRVRVLSALQGLMIAPDAFGTSAGAYLGLATASARLKRARNDTQLRETADYLWAMALQIEDGDLSDIERELRAAQQQLREALQRGASDEELKKLTDNLRAAMDKFLRELAERASKEPQSADADARKNSRTLTSDDLKSMLDRMEEMARSGNLADAQKMLEQLQSMLENLQTAKRRGSPSEAQREMNRAMSELDGLTREQQQLRDETFQNRQNKDGKKSARKPKQNQQGQRGQQSQPGQGQPGQDDADDGDDDQMADGDGAQPGQDGQPGSQQGGQPSMEQLQRRQKNLRDRLADVQRKLKSMGQNGAPGLGEAEGAMGEAEEALREGQSGMGKAVDAQGRALDALRKGAQQLADSMQQQGEGEGGEQADDGSGEPSSGQPRQADRDSGSDPLGRPMSKDPSFNPRSKYDPLGVAPALRAQRVLEELRKRLGDTARPPAEIDYLERLLRRY